MSAQPSKSDKADNPDKRPRQRGAYDNPLASSVRRALGGKSNKWLAHAAGISESTLSDGLARGVIKSDAAIALARVLGLTLDELLADSKERSVPAPSGRLLLANDAEWIDVPQHDLREISDESLGKPVSTTPIRRDWLYSATRATTDLWLTRLLSSYPAAGLSEDELVICRTVAPQAVPEGALCLWRVAGRIVIGRFSVVPDAQLASGAAVGGAADPRILAGSVAAFLDPSLGIPSTDLVVPPSRMGESGPYHLVGRILGVMVRPL